MIPSLSHLNALCFDSSSIGVTSDNGKNDTGENVFMLCLVMYQSNYAYYLLLSIILYLIKVSTEPDV